MKESQIDKKNQKLMKKSQNVNQWQLPSEISGHFVTAKSHKTIKEK